MTADDPMVGLRMSTATVSEWIRHGDESSTAPGPDAVTRTMGYDSLGRMTVNLEPSTSEGNLGWRYVYDDSGRLVGTSDARKCGVNFSYDAAGRILTEDYSPCEAHHAPYTAEAEVEHAAAGHTAGVRRAGNPTELRDWRMPEECYTMGYSNNPFEIWGRESDTAEHGDPDFLVF